MDPNKTENTEEKPLDAAEVHEKSLEELIAEDNASQAGETPEPKEEIKAEEKAEETPELKEEPKPEPTPQIDPDKLKAEISQEVAQKVVESLTGGEKKEGEQYPWEKEGRSPTYDEALQYVKEKAKAEIKAELEAEVEEEERKEAEQAEQTKKAQQDTNEAWGTYWANQLKELEQSGKIPAVQQAGDPGDAGVKARVALFSKMREVSEERQSKGQPVISSLKEIFYEHYTPNSQPAGADAPVFGGGKSVSTPDQKDFSYSEIHNASVEDLLTGRS